MQHLLKQIKDFIASVVYRFLLIVVKLLPAEKGDNHLLLVKLDEIGDYIIFRNNLKIIRQSKAYKNHKITLIGNAIWKSVFELYDTDTVDEVIWVEKKKFNWDLGYRFSLLRKTRCLKISDVINCVFSRNIKLEDGFAYVAKGKRKFAMSWDKSNATRFAINIDRLIYTEIIDAGNERIFDSIRNSNFLQKILGTDIPFDTKLPFTDDLPIIADRYFVVFIGAGNAERKWSMENFANSALHIISKYQLKPVICGGPGDKEDAEKLSRLLNDKVENYTGKTTMSELINILKNCKFLISVDTGPLHIGVAAGCPVIGLFSGKYYRRYAPYPIQITSKMYPVYPDFIDLLIEKDSPLLYNQFIIKNNTIKLIQHEKITPYVDKIMANL